jgi:PKD domain
MPTPAVTSGNLPHGIAVSPSGQSVYVTNGGTNGSGGVSQYSVGAGGALAPQATPTFATGNNPAGIAVTPDQGPVASFTVSATPAGSASSFDASGSSSADSTVASYQWSFGDGSTTASGSASVTHTYARPGTYTAQLTVVDADGCSTLTVFTGQTASCNANAAATTTRTVVVPAVVVPKVAVSNVSVSPRTFSAAGRKVHGTCAQPSTRNKRDKPCQRSIKLTAKYTLNAAATVGFRLALQTSGRKVSGKCVKASRKNKHDHKCMLLVSVHNTIRRSGVAGSNKFTFTGKLVAGTYELTVTPAGGTAHTVTFKVSG